MSDDVDPVLEAVKALRAGGVEAELCGDDVECWRVGDFVLDNDTLLRLAARMGPVEDGASV